MGNRGPGALNGLAVVAIIGALSCAAGGGDSGPADAAPTKTDGGFTESDGYGSGYPDDGPAGSDDGAYGVADAPGSGGGYDTGSAYDANGGYDANSGYDASSGYDSGIVVDAGGDAPAEVGTDAAATGLSVLYAVEDSSAMSAYIGCSLTVANSGAASVTVSNLAVRYYYVNVDTHDAAPAPQMTINWSHITTSGANADLTVTYSFNALQPSATEANSYIEFDLASSHTALGPGETAVFSWQVQGPDPAQDVYNQNDDYSFNASMTSPTSWSHVVLTRGGSVVWGTPP